MGKINEWLNQKDYKDYTVEELEKERIKIKKTYIIIFLIYFISSIGFVITTGFGKWFLMDIIATLLILSIIVICLIYLVLFKIDIFIYLKKKDREL